MADYWIKMYHEILDDPKMATMPDRLWRKTVEIFLLAGKLSKDKSGVLPETNQLAWLLRMNTDDLLLDLKQLETAGIVKKHKDGWIVVNFEKRQSASSDSERKKNQRERSQRNQYYGNENVTSLSRNVTQINRVQNTESETETEEIIIDRFSSIQKLIEQITGYPPNGAKGIDAIREIERMGATDEDIRAGIKWKIDNGHNIRFYQSLVEPIRTAMSIRLQSKSTTNKYENVLTSPS